MKDLTAAEQSELADDLQKFVQDQKLVGLGCIVAIYGRGVFKLAYAQEDAISVPIVLECALESSREYNANKAN